MESKIVNESQVVFKTSQDVELTGSLNRMTRFLAVFELYNPVAELRLSEVLKDFRIVVGDQGLYSGKAVVRNLINGGSAVVVCEATLSESGWTDVDFSAPEDQLHKLTGEYRGFMAEWQKLYRVRPEYKLVLADMQMYFTDLRLWLNQLELGVRAAPSGNGSALEHEVVGELAQATLESLSALFERFEDAAREVEEDLIPAHRVFAKRQLHPLLLCSPFFNRCFVKPLGYAGDYEMVNMMLRDPCEGGSLFAKVMNLWFLAQPPVMAHRNRIDYLANQLLQVALRASRQGRTARVITLGCGPAQEIQRFVAEHPFTVDFTLLDFNEETLQYTRTIMDALKLKHQQRSQFHYIKKSVHHLLKETGKPAERSSEAKYDLVYCAGLFDYLSTQVCQRLMDIMYEWVKPGGLLIATNVHSCNPSIGWMELMVDWHLIYRDSRQMAALVPKKSPPDNARIVAEDTGVNVFVEVPKPEHA